MPVRVFKHCLTAVPGQYEGELLIIFDKAYKGNSLVDARELAEDCYRGYTKFFHEQQYDNICYLLFTTGMR